MTTELFNKTPIRKIISIPDLTYDWFADMDFRSKEIGSLVHPCRYDGTRILRGSGKEGLLKWLAAQAWTDPGELIVVRYCQKPYNARAGWCPSDSELHLRISHLNFALDHGPSLKNSIGVKHGSRYDLLALRGIRNLDFVWDEYIIPHLGPTCDIEE